MKCLLLLAEGRQRAGLEAAAALHGQAGGLASALGRCAWARNVAALCARMGSPGHALAWSRRALTEAHGAEVPLCNQFARALESVLGVGAQASEPAGRSANGALVAPLKSGEVEDLAAA